MKGWIIINNNINIIINNIMGEQNIQLCSIFILVKSTISTSVPIHKIN